MAIIDKNIVFMLLPVFRYWIKVKITKPIEIIKKHTAGISPSNERILSKFPINFNIIYLNYWH